MTKERELLARAGLIIAQYRWSDPEDQALRKLSEQINAYFEEPTQDEKPVAYWDTQEGKLIPAVPLSSKRTCFEAPLVPLYLHPAPRPEFVRLSEEEVDSLTYAPYEPYKLICAVENLLVEKNNAF